jgi:hypothetical protein
MQLVWDYQDYQESYPGLLNPLQDPVHNFKNSVSSNFSFVDKILPLFPSVLSPLTERWI